MPTDVPNDHLSSDGSVIPRMSLTEVGYTGLKVSAGIIYEEARRDLRWPQSIKTFKEMAHDPTIAAALKAIELMISKVKWSVVPPPQATEKQKTRAKYVEECMHDMEHSWFHFLKEVCSVFTYGFSIHEKVYRRRWKRNGSKYNDGLVGLRKLPIRSQDTVYRWLYAPDGRDLVAVKQSLGLMNDQMRYTDAYWGQQPLTIPRENFMLFRTDAYKDNPEGRSPLLSVFGPWKVRVALEEIEAIGYSRNMSGVPHLELHPKYMDPNGSDDDKRVFAYYQNIIRNMHNNEQAGLITPLMYDPESKQPLFKFSLLSVPNSGAQHIKEAITRYDNKILTALLSDILRLGQDQVGSYSLKVSDLCK